MNGIYKSEAGKQSIQAFYRKVLGRWPVASEQLFIQTRHGETFVVASGPADAPPLVLLHGSGSNSAIWIRDVVEWAQHHRVYAIDIIGEPGLSAPTRPPLRSNAYAEWLADVWQALGVPAASVVGVSLGGWLALDYAVKRPARVTSLSLLSPAGIGARRRLFMLEAGLMLLFGKLGVATALSTASGNRTIAPAVAQYMKLIFENFRPRREKPPIRTDDELRALTMPVQVVVGASDAMIHSARTRERVMRLIPHAEMTTIEDAGHLLPPQTARVGDFLAGIGAGTSATPKRTAHAAGSPACDAQEQRAHSATGA